MKIVSLSRGQIAMPLLAVLVATTPAAAFQQVEFGPRAPSFAAVGSGLGWGGLPMPSVFAPAGQLSSAATPWRDPQSWAFTSGQTERVGSFLFNTVSGPSWSVGSPLGFSAGPGGFGRFGDLGYTTRSTAAVLAAQNLMLYTSVGQTTYGSFGSAVPVAPGLALIEQPTARTDVRAGFKMELMPGLSFGMEAAFSPPQR